MTQREKVVEHVSQMIRTLGVKSVRMDDVAAGLGMSKRTLYEMFGDKEELIYQSIKHYSQQLKERREALIAEVNNPLEAMIVSLRDMIIDAPVTCRLRRNMSRFYPAVYQRLEQEMQSDSRAKLSSQSAVVVK